MSIDEVLSAQKKRREEERIKKQCEPYEEIIRRLRKLDREGAKLKQSQPGMHHRIENEDGNCHDDFRNHDRKIHEPGEGLEVTYTIVFGSEYGDDLSGKTMIVNFKGFDHVSCSINLTEQIIHINEYLAEICTADSY